MALKAKVKLAKSRNLVILPLGIEGAPVTTATQNVTYVGFVVQGVGGVPGYTYSVFSGAFPTGILLDSVTGVVAGVPTESGTFANIVLRVTDAAGQIRNLPAFDLDVTAQSGSDAESVAARLHVPTNPRNIIYNTILPEFAGLWSGTPSSGWDTDQLAVDGLDLSNKIKVLDQTKHHRIRLKNTGDFSYASYPTYGTGGSKRDFRANGGSLRIEPESGQGPTITCIGKFSSLTNVEVINITWGRGVTVTRNSGFARSVMIFRNCRFGDEFVDYGDGSSPWTNSQLLDGFVANYSDEIQLLDCSFKRVKACFKSLSTRRMKIARNDFQRMVGDAISISSSLVYDPDDGQRIDQKYASDPYVYTWILGNVARNIIDDPVASAGASPHNDFAQFGPAGANDALNYRSLIEFNVSYMERFNTWSSGGTQGVYQDDSSKAQQIVSHSNYYGMNAYNVMGAYGGGSVDSWTYHDHCLGFRTAKTESAVDGEPRVYAFRLSEWASTAETTCYMSNSVFGAAGSPNNATIEQENCAYASPRIAKQGTAEDYSSNFSGVFSTDIQGKTTYDFDDSGTNSLDDFRAAVAAQFAPKAAIADKMPPDPSLWSLALAA